MPGKKNITIETCLECQRPCDPAWVTGCRCNIDFEEGQFGPWFDAWFASRKERRGKHEDAVYEWATEDPAGEPPEWEEGKDV